MKESANINKTIVSQKTKYHLTIHSSAIVSAISGVIFVEYLGFIIDIFTFAVMTVVITRIIEKSEKTTNIAKKDDNEKLISKIVRVISKIICGAFGIIFVKKIMKVFRNVGSKIFRRIPGCIFQIFREAFKKGLKKTLCKFIKRVFSPQIKIIVDFLKNTLAKITGKPLAKIAEKPLAKIAEKPLAKIAGKNLAKSAGKNLAKSAGKNLAKSAGKTTAMYSFPLLANDFVWSLDLIVPLIISIVLFEFAGWSIIYKHKKKKMKELSK